MFADLHNHNHSRTYFWLYPDKKLRKVNSSYHAWITITSNIKARENGKMGASYSQSDLTRLVQGNVKLTFNALYPIEKGFFRNFGIDDGGKLDLHPVRAFIRKLQPLRIIAQARGYMDIPVKMAAYLSSGNYKYWPSLNEEYGFIAEKSGIKMRSTLYKPSGLGLFESFQRIKINKRIKKGKEQAVEGTYFIPKKSTEVSESLSKDQITMVLTIEGGHALGIDQGGVGDWLANIDFIKNKWAHPVFFITFAHHFYNKLCGHAHSIPPLGRNVFNQNHGMKLGFSEEGLKVIRKLLSLDQHNQLIASEKYRILIDVKHMNAGSRSEFYEKIVRPCIGTPSQFPVVASHVAYSGRKELIDHSNNYDYETKDYFYPQGEYNNAWNINMCDEDVVMIIKTEGLIGISMDQRILGVPSDKKEEERADNNNVKAIAYTIYQIVEAAHKSQELTAGQKENAWCRVALGSDFEGLINPIDDYATVVSYKDLKDHLIKFFETEYLQQGKQLYGLNSLAEIQDAVQMICYQNAADFVVKHYPI